MSPREIWCNEAQERYVLAIAPADLGRFDAICARERCPYAVVGRANGEGRLVVDDPHFGNAPVDVPLDVILGKPPKMQRDARRIARALPPLDLRGVRVRDAAYRVLQLPAVADKTFLVTIGDRTVGGLCARDPMVGPWQVPVADVAVTLADFAGHAGEAMAMGERVAGRADRRAGIGAHGGRRGDHQPRGGAHRRSGRGQAVGQLDGGSGATGRGRGALRHRARGGDRSVRPRSD